MRVAIIMSAVLGLVTNALAADLDDSVIRGSSGYQPGVPLYYRWNGAYAGGQVGYSTGQFDFSSATGPQTQLILGQPFTFSNPITGKDNTSAAAYGTFVGVNSQWDDVILGAELSYNHTNLLAASSGSFLVTLRDNNTYTLTGTAAAHILDYATIRGRMGYAFSRFLPYAFAGVAVARADLSRVTSLSGPINTPPNLPVSFTPQTVTQGQQSSFLYGYALGAGMDIAVMPNVFVRAEYEFIGFVQFMTSTATLQSARIGAAVQF
jgi:outer membrane immunogenic protein